MRYASMWINCLLMVVTALSVYCQQNGIYTFIDSRKSFAQISVPWIPVDDHGAKIRFQTVEGDALLYYHEYRQLSDTKYALWIELVNREVRITHLYNTYEENISLGKALDDDAWHTVTYERKSNGWLHFSLDGINAPVKYLYAYSDGDAQETFSKLTKSSNIFIGGLWQSTKTPGNRNFTHFIGCVRSPDLLISGEFKTFTMHNSSNLVQEGCVNKCDRENFCKNGGICINKYMSTTCDCRHTNFIGWNCDTPDEAVITLNGYDYIEFTIGTESANTYSANVYVNINFKMEPEQRSGVLIYGHSFSTGLNFVAIEITDGTLKATINFGDTTLSYHFNETKVNDNSWYKLTLQHAIQELTVNLERLIDGTSYTRNDTLPQRSYLYLGRTVYIGGGPLLKGYEGLLLGSNFVGCLKHVIFEVTNVLHELPLNSSAVKYIGESKDSKPELECREIGHSSVIFPTSTSQLILRGWNDGNLNLRFDLKTVQRNSVLLLVAVRANNGHRGIISLRIIENRVHGVLEIEENDIRSLVNKSVVVGENLNNTLWHTLEFSMEDGSVTLSVDQAKASFQIKDLILYSDSDIYLGGGWTNSGQGFEGCMQNIIFQSAELYPNEIMNTNMVNGVTIGSCQVSDPCSRSGLVCENRGRCTYNTNEERVHCDCSGTGYSGPTCNFPIFKRTCGEYYYSGDRKSGMKSIDTDGVGKLHAADVFCDFRNGEIKTIIEHNFEEQTDVRRMGWGGVATFRLQYRNVTGSILKFLVDHADQCQQDITYWCWKAPIRFGIATKFKSPKGWIMPTANMTNYCDSNKDELLYDEGVLNEKKYLPVAQMDFSQDHNQKQTLAKMSLGPLKCNGMLGYTEGYILTFLKHNAILKMKPWSSGILSLSFCVTKNNSVIFHQLRSKTNANELMAKVYNGHTMEFSYRLNGQNDIIRVRTNRQLTDGDWHLITIERSSNAVRFSVDMENKILMIKEEEKIKPYEGRFLLGGSLGNVQGMIGCIAGLTINNRVVYLANIYRDKPRVVRDTMAIGCNTLCHEDACKNGGRCLERFTSYDCECTDPASSGERCEFNYNDDAVSFPEGNAYLSLDLSNNAILTSSFLVGVRTTSKDAFFLHAQDSFSNFVSLEMVDGQLKLTWNTNRIIRNMILKSEVRTFSDGDWLDIRVQRKDAAISLVVGDEKVTMLTPVTLLEQFYSDPFQQGITKPSPASYDVVTLYVGGMLGSEINLKGCVRGLVIDGQSTKLQGSGISGIVDKCEHHCLPTPCLNGGKCVETWYDFYCNCTETSYTGRQCQEDIGAYFHNSNGIIAKLTPSNTPDTTSLETDYFLMSFSTETAPGVLAYVRSPLTVTEQEYIIVHLTEYGDIMAKVNMGQTEHTLQALGGPYNDGYRHLISLRRYGNRIMMTVDNGEMSYEDLTADNGDNQFESRSVLVVGGIEKNLTGFGLDGLIAYTGCLTGVDYNGNQPINTFYASTSAIEFTSDNLRSGTCAEFKTPIVVIPTESTKPTEEPEIMLPPWNVPPAMPIISEASTGDSGGNKIITAFVASLLAIIIVVLLICNIWTALKIKQLTDQEKRNKKKVRIDEEQPFIVPSDGYELSDLVMRRTGGDENDGVTTNEVTDNTDVEFNRDSFALRDELEWDPQLDRSKLQQAASPAARNPPTNITDDEVTMETPTAPLIDFDDVVDEHPTESASNSSQLDLTTDKEEPLRRSGSSSSSSSASSFEFVESSSTVMDTSQVATLITLPNFEPSLESNNQGTNDENRQKDDEAQEKEDDKVRIQNQEAQEEDVTDLINDKEDVDNEDAEDNDNYIIQTTERNDEKKEDSAQNENEDGDDDINQTTVAKEDGKDDGEEKAINEPKKLSVNSSSNEDNLKDIENAIEDTEENKKQRDDDSQSNSSRKDDKTNELSKMDDDEKREESAYQVEVENEGKKENEDDTTDEKNDPITLNDIIEKNEDDGGGRIEGSMDNEEISLPGEPDHEETDERKPENSDEMQSIFCDVDKEEVSNKNSEGDNEDDDKKGSSSEDVEENGSNENNSPGESANNDDDDGKGDKISNSLLDKVDKGSSSNENKEVEDDRQNNEVENQEDGKTIDSSDKSSSSSSLDEDEKESKENSSSEENKQEENYKNNEEEDEVVKENTSSDDASEGS